MILTFSRFLLVILTFLFVISVDFRKILVIFTFFFGNCVILTFLRFWMI